MDELIIDLLLTNVNRLQVIQCSGMSLHLLRDSMTEVTDIVKVLFLCLGNICRSPMAEAVFRQMVKERGLEEQIEIDSAGLGGWHIGERPHQGTLKILTKNGIPHETIHSRQIQQSDIQNFDYIVAMDEENLQGLKKFGVKPGSKVFRLLDLVEEKKDKDVPDPYYRGNFDDVYDLVRLGCERLLEKLARDL